jgi:predicted TIM-barrel fold metal-dependent hydrolase
MLDVLDKSQDGKADAAAPILAVSADSHIVEPPNCYTDHIDPAYRDRAPYIAVNPENGAEGFFVHGFARPISLGPLAAAGIDPKEIRLDRASFNELHRGGWDPKVRLADQDRDGVQAELIYPTVGMLICNHPDGDYKNACMWAYNRWLEEFCSGAPSRLYGLGQMVVKSASQAVADLERMKAMGFKGVMMPGEPETDEDYCDPMFDPLWQASIALDMPISFHVLTNGMTKSFTEGKNFLGGGGSDAKTLRAEGIRGPRIGGSFGIIRACQDILSMFIFGRVFERNPELKVVCVEADAGWAPHFMYRMDHFYRRHRYWLQFGEMARLPSEYFKENIYLTFQDDWAAFKVADLLNSNRLMWANDFPHSDSTWPWSQELLSEHGAGLSEAVRQRILRDNAAELYKIPVV